MLEEKIDVLIEQQKVTNDYLGQLIELMFDQVSARPQPCGAEAHLSKPDKPAKKVKVTENTEQPVEEPAPGKTLKDIVDLCSTGEVTRSMILTLLDEYGAKKLPDLDSKVVPEFYDRLVELKNQQSEAA